MSADALACRLAAAMCLAAAGIFLACLVVVTRLPVVAPDPTGAIAYAIPGTGHMIDPAIRPVLAWSGGLAAVVGALAWALSLTSPGSAIRAAGLLSGGRRPLGRSLAILLAGAAGLAAVLVLKR